MKHTMIMDIVLNVIVDIICIIITVLMKDTDIVILVVVEHIQMDHRLRVLLVQQEHIHQLLEHVVVKHV